MRGVSVYYLKVRLFAGIAGALQLLLAVVAMEMVQGLQHSSLKLALLRGEEREQSYVRGTKSATQQITSSIVMRLQG